MTPALVDFIRKVAASAVNHDLAAEATALLREANLPVPSRDHGGGYVLVDGATHVVVGEEIYQTADAALADLDSRLADVIAVWVDYAPALRASDTGGDEEDEEDDDAEGT